MAATYTLPDEASLAGAPDRTVVQGLKYECKACGKTLASVEQMKHHVGGAKHAKALKQKSLSESSTILQELETFTELEAPHREDAKLIRQGKWDEHHRIVEEELAALTPEDREKRKKEKQDYKEKRAAERKAKAAPRVKKSKQTAAEAAKGIVKNGKLSALATKSGKNAKAKQEATAAKKMPDVKKGAENAFRCKVCDMTLNSAETLKIHKQGKKHAQKARTNANIAQGKGKGGKGKGGKGGWGSQSVQPWGEDNGMGDNYGWGLDSTEMKARMMMALFMAKAKGKGNKGW